MSGTVMFTQVLLPLGLLAWCAFFPAAGWLARGLQLISVAAVLLGIGLVALWTMPPYWTPFIYGLAIVLILVSDCIWRRHPGPGLWRISVSGTILILILAALGLAGGHLTWQAMQGRVLPDDEVVDIAPPFASGHYLVAHGGSTPMVNVHLKTLDQTVERFRLWRGQSKALDIFRTTRIGIHKEGWQPTDPGKYKTFGAPVVAPCPGEVALVVDGIADMPVPDMDRDHMAGNHVAIDCGDFFVILAHLRQGSVTVFTGAEVETGDPLAEMGNSGNSSEPHLHVHAQRELPADAPLSGQPLWLTIDDRFLVRNDRLHVF